MADLIVKRTFLSNLGSAQEEPIGYFLTSIANLLNGPEINQITVEWANGDVSIYEIEKTDD